MQFYPRARGNIKPLRFLSGSGFGGVTGLIDQLVSAETRHATAFFSARATALYAFLHVPHPFAILSAGIANLGANFADLATES